MRATSRQRAHASMLMQVSAGPLMSDTQERGHAARWCAFAPFRSMATLVQRGHAAGQRSGIAGAWCSRQPGSELTQACYCRLARARSRLMHASARMLHDFPLYRAHARALAQ